MPRAERAPPGAVQIWRLEYPAAAAEWDRQELEVERSEAEQAEKTVRLPLAAMHRAGASAATTNGGSKPPGDVRDPLPADHADSGRSDRGADGSAATKAAWESIMHQHGVPVDYVSVHHLYLSCFRNFMPA